MGALTNLQVLTITRAVVLATAARDVLSDFEAELVREVALRFRTFGRWCAVTVAEWAVIEDAIAAMHAAFCADRSRGPA